MQTKTHEDNPSLKVGIVGCGVIAGTHLTAYQALPGVEVTWLCDCIYSKAESLASEFGVPQATASYWEMLEATDLDCLSVCTDHASHAPLSIAALEAGKHVLCEKALAASRQGLDAMIAADQSHPELIFAGVFQHRFDPVYQALRAGVEEGVFGDILTGGVRLYCRRKKDYYQADSWRGTWAKEGGSVLINQAIHFIDALAWITGGVRRICGRYANLTHGSTIETEDTAVASLEFKKGGLGIVEATSSSATGWAPHLHLQGTRGAVEVRNGEIINADFKEAAAKAELEAQIRSFTGAKTAGAGAIGKEYYGTGHTAQITDFIDAVKTGRQPAVTSESARHAVDIVLAIYEAHRQQKWVDVGVQ
ncbi:MAG: Gfo/Idh/MocA family oxidoreductase [Lentisphaeria bacterium]